MVCWRVEKRKTRSVVGCLKKRGKRFYLPWWTRRQKVPYGALLKSTRPRGRRAADPPTVRSGEWPAWFSFWFSGCWRALAKGTAWAGFYCVILLLLAPQIRPHCSKSAAQVRKSAAQVRKSAAQVQVRNKCGTSVEQVRHKCGTSAAQVRSKFGAQFGRVRNAGGCAARRLLAKNKTKQKQPPKAQNTKKDGKKTPNFFSPSGLFAGTRRADPLRICGEDFGTAAAPVRNWFGTGAEAVRIARGTGAERMRNGRGTGAERQRNAGAERRRICGAASSNKTEQRAVLFELDPTGSQANKYTGGGVPKPAVSFERQSGRPVCEISESTSLP